MALWRESGYQLNWAISQLSVKISSHQLMLQTSDLSHKYTINKYLEQFSASGKPYLGPLNILEGQGLLRINQP